MKNTPIFRILVIVSIIAITVFYSIFEKSKITSLSESAKELKQVVSELPKYKLKNFHSADTMLTKESALKRNSALLIYHFWGTWCAPCEAEFPALMEFINKVSANDATFFLIASNDEDLKIKKFLKRFEKNMPDYAIVAHDKNGETLPYFGTARVPETYVFNRKGLLVEKFVGPQDWHKEYFVDRVRQLADQNRNI